MIKCLAVCLLNSSVEQTGKLRGVTVIHFLILTVTHLMEVTTCTGGFVDAYFINHLAGDVKVVQCSTTRDLMTRICVKKVAITHLI